jgi:AbrB family looped-hinge helix DNA binding protein
MDPTLCAMMPVITTVTLGQKGQIVIPKEAREMLGLTIDSKLVLVAKADGIMLFPVEQMQHFLDMMQRQLINSGETVVKN